MSSKALRSSLTTDEDDVICVYKIGTILTMAEVLSWTNRLSQLTSTRHKNIILRLVHGDIFSNSRLNRFGLRQDANCANCGETNETITHKVQECCKAAEAWQILEETKRLLKLNTLSDLSMENLIGAKDRVCKIELALQAELIHRLTARDTTYHPRAMVKEVVKFIGHSERLNENLKKSFDEVIGNWQ